SERPEVARPDRRRRGSADSVPRAHRAHRAAGRRARRTELLSARVPSAWAPAYHSRMPASPTTRASDRAESRSREWVLCMAIGMALTAVLTFPTLQYFGSVGRFDTGDGR